MEKFHERLADGDRPDDGPSGVNRAKPCKEVQIIS